MRRLATETRGRPAASRGRGDAASSSADLAEGVPYLIWTGKVADTGQGREKTTGRNGKTIGRKPQHPVVRTTFTGLTDRGRGRALLAGPNAWNARHLRVRQDTRAERPFGAPWTRSK